MVEFKTVKEAKNAKEHINGIEYGPVTLTTEWPAEHQELTDDEVCCVFEKACFVFQTNHDSCRPQKLLLAQTQGLREAEQANFFSISCFVKCVLRA
jgi:hypothetical protein